MRGGRVETVNSAVVGEGRRTWRVGGEVSIVRVGVRDGMACHALSLVGARY